MQELELDVLMGIIHKAFACIDAQILMNLYATENVVFGRINVNEPIPFERYIQDLKLQCFAPYLNQGQLDGHSIEKGFIKDRPFDELCYELYRDKVDCIFDSVPIDKSFESNDDDVFHYKFGLYDYIKDIYPLFQDILKTEVDPEPFASIPDILDDDIKFDYYTNVIKFILAIKLKGLRQGSRIDRYITKLPLISPLVMRLIKKQKGHYYLKNNNIYSLDYKLALFSCFRFLNEDNAKLFELKALKWEELNC